MNAGAAGRENQVGAHTGPAAAAEAALALACEEELRAMGNANVEHWEDPLPLQYDLEEDEVKLAAALMVLGEVETEVVEEGCVLTGEAPDEECRNLEAEVEDLRRLVAALTHRVNRKRILYKCLEQYKPK